jgi:hypothetical protein
MASGTTTFAPDFDVDDKSSTSNDWLIAVLAAAAAIVCLCIILIAALLLRRRRRRGAAPDSRPSQLKSAGTMEWESAKADVDDLPAPPSPVRASTHDSPYGSLRVDPAAAPSANDYGIVLPSSSGYAQVSSSGYAQMSTGTDALSARTGTSEQGYGILPAQSTPYTAMPARSEASSSNSNIKFV